MDDNEARLVCPECLSEDITQTGRIEASWGGEAIEVTTADGPKERKWRDDGMGATVHWDAYEITGYFCMACAAPFPSLSALTIDEEEED